MAIGSKSLELGMAILAASLGVGGAGAADSGDSFTTAMGESRSVVRAGGLALEPAGEISVRGSVQIFRAATMALTRLHGELETAKVELEALRAARTLTEIEADIAALDPAAFDSEGGYIAALTRFEVEKLGAVRGSERSDLIATKQDRISALQAEIDRYGQDRATAWQSLTRGRGLSYEALAVLKEKLAME